MARLELSDTQTPVFFFCPVPDPVIQVDRVWHALDATQDWLRRFFF